MAGALALASLLSLAPSAPAAVDIELSRPGWVAHGAGFVYPRGPGLTLEGDLREGTTSATVYFTQWGSRLRVRTRRGSEVPEVVEGRAELVGPADPVLGSRWTLTLGDTRVEVWFRDTPKRPRPPRAAPSPAAPPPPRSGDDEAVGCSGSPGRDSEPRPADRQDGSGCGGDPYDDPGYDDPGYDDPGYDDPGYDDPGYDDPGYDGGGSDASGSGCGGDPVDAPDDDDGGWSDDEGASCGGDPVDAPDDNGEPTDSSASCADVEGDEVDEDYEARLARRAVRFAWPFLLVLGLNRGARRWQSRPPPGS